jgi:tetratricopeptide (TPR) repeat protein
LIRISCFGILISAAAGCVNQAEVDARNAVADYQAADYADARRLLQPLAKDPNENFALNNCRLGSTDLAMYDLAGGQAALLQAYDVLNSYGVNNGGRTAGAVLVDEGGRIWTGEPFERAMANFYLGLTYYQQRDYNNARGAFENALFKLRDYGVGNSDSDQSAPPQADKYHDVDSNFALAQYLLARCCQRLGQDDQAATAFARTVALRSDLAALADPRRNAAANVLVIVDFGEGPRKGTSRDGSFVGFVPHPNQAGPIPLPQLFVDGRYADTAAVGVPLVDLLQLAQDTRWQTIDTIRTVKSALGTGLLAGGALTTVAAQNRTTGEVGLGLLAAGVLLKATSQADLRVWDTLPRATFAIPMSIPPGRHDLTVTFPTYGGQRQVWHGLVIPPDGEVTFYVRMHRYEANEQAWPPPTLTGWPETAPPPAGPPATPPVMVPVAPPPQPVPPVMVPVTPPPQPPPAGNDLPPPP